MHSVSAAETSEHKSMKTHEPSTHLVDDMDFMEAGNVEVAHGPFAAHIEESDISVRQVLSAIVYVTVVCLTSSFCGEISHTIWRQCR